MAEASASLAILVDAVLLPESFRGGCSFGATTSVVSPAVVLS